MPTHLALGASAGLTDEQLSWLSAWEESPVFDDAERLVLRYTDVLTREVRVDDALWDELSGRFSQQEIVELCFAVGLAALVNRVHATFLTDVDERTAQRITHMDLPGDILPEMRR